MTSFKLNLTFLPMVGAVDAALFREHNLSFALNLVQAWNAALVSSAVVEVQPHSSHPTAATGMSSASEPVAVSSMSVLSAAAGSGGGAVISLGVVASVARMTAIWASLNSTSAAAASPSSFQHLCVGVLLSGSFGFPANLTVGQLWVGKTCANCFVCVDRPVCDTTAPYDPQCGHDEAPSHGYCVWKKDENTCQCNQGFAGPNCGDGGLAPMLPITLQQVVGVAAGVLSIAVSLYVSRKYAIARLRSRHRPSINGGRAPGKFDCRDRITIALLCGTYHEDGDDDTEAMEFVRELADPLVPQQKEVRKRWSWCCCQWDEELAAASMAESDGPRDAFSSAQSQPYEQSRDEYGSAQSHASQRLSGIRT
jgi:hypothetical protein